MSINTGSLTTTAPSPTGATTARPQIPYGYVR
jgi:hypothetical protein